MTECRDIPAHRGYRVGDDGSVWSCLRRIGRGPGRGTATVVTETWRQLKATVASRTSPYLIVVLTCPRRTRTVHSLVLEAFAGPRPAGMVACHNDGNRLNNRADNLRWDTHRANEADKAKHDTKIHGTRNHAAKLTEQDIRVIREELGADRTTRLALSKRFGVHRRTIGAICNRETWTHVQGRPARPLPRADRSRARGRPVRGGDMSKKHARLGCVTCDAARDPIGEKELERAIEAGWEDVGRVQTFRQAAAVYDDPADAPAGYSVLDWWTHLGHCPDCVAAGVVR